MKKLFEDILDLLEINAFYLTENDMSFLHYEMDTYKLIYEIDGLRLIKVQKNRFKGINGGLLTSNSHKVLVRTKIEKKAHKLAILECNIIELQNVYFELKHKIECQK